MNNKISNYIELNNLLKSYNGLNAVDKINLNVHENEFFVLLGPSGCGKSTTLRMIAGLDYPTGGSISINGNEITNLDPKDRNIAFVFQNYALYPHMNVRHNLSYSMKLRKIPKPEINQKLDWVTNLLKIENLLNRKPSQLSGGQRQRVALGRALVRDPSVFLLDEPLSNLDAQLRSETRSELIALQKKLKKTFIYVTHDQVEAMTMATRICIMNNGKILQIGSPIDVYNNPSCLFVARFLSNPINNILKSSIKTNGNKIYVNALLNEFSFNEKYEKKEIYISIRPENLLLNQEHGDLPSLEIEINQIENHGHEFLLSGFLNTQEDQIIYLRARNIDNIIKNKKIKIFYETKNLIFYDIETEEVLR